MAKKATKKMGRPSKINSFVKKFREQMEIPDIARQVVFLTDAELVFLVNEMLPIKDRISDMTFRRWKARETGGDVEGVDPLDEVGSEFCSLYKKALILQKAALFKRLLSPTEAQWQRIAWIIERKFEEWNIRQKSEVEVKEQRAVTIIKKYDNE